MIAVRTAPASTPKRGLVNTRNSWRNWGTSCRPATAPDMAFMPYIRVANPNRIIPESLFLSCLQNRYSTIPASASSGVKEVGFISLMNQLSPLIPARLRIHAVTVVPILAPIITPMDCRSVIKPELTNPTTITVVAEEL